MAGYGLLTQNTIQGSVLEGSNMATFTFPGGGTTSTVINTWGRAVLALYLPNTVLGTSWQILGAYNIAVPGQSDTPSTFFPYVNIAGEPVGTQIVTASLPCVIGLTPIEILGLNYIKFMSNVAETNIPVIEYTFRTFK